MLTLFLRPTLFSVFSLFAIASGAFGQDTGKTRSVLDGRPLEASHAAEQSIHWLEDLTIARNRSAPGNKLLPQIFKTRLEKVTRIDLDKDEKGFYKFQLQTLPDENGKTSAIKLTLEREGRPVGDNAEVARRATVAGPITNFTNWRKDKPASSLCEEALHLVIDNYKQDEKLSVYYTEFESLTLRPLGADGNGDPEAQVDIRGRKVKDTLRVFLTSDGKVKRYDFVP